MNEEAKFNKLEAALRGFDLPLQCVDDHLDRPTNVKYWKLLVRKQCLQFRLCHEMLHSFNLKLPVLKPIDFGREERRDEEGLAQEDGLSICSAEIVIEGSF